MTVDDVAVKCEGGGGCFLVTEIEEVEEVVEEEEDCED